MLYAHDVSDCYGNSRSVAEKRIGPIGPQQVDEAKVLISYVDMHSFVLELRTEGEIVPRFINELLSSEDRKKGIYTFFCLRIRKTI